MGALLDLPGKLISAACTQPQCCSTRNTLTHLLNRTINDAIQHAINTLRGDHMEIYDDSEKCEQWLPVNTIICTEQQLAS